MNSWIFQAVAEKRDLRALTAINEGDTLTWRATRYRDKMTPDDVVFFWQGGVALEERGIYGWGTIQRPDEFRPGWTSYRVEILCRRRFPTPLPEGRILRFPPTSQLLIIRIRVGSNFLLTEEEAHGLASLCLEHDREGPPLPL